MSFLSKIVWHSRQCAQAHCRDETTTPRFVTCRGVSVSPRFAHTAERPSKTSDWQFDQGNKFLVHNSLCIEKKTNQHCLDIGLHLTRFFGARRARMIPLTWSLFGFRVVPIAPAFIASDDLRKNQDQLETGLSVRDTRSLVTVSDPLWARGAQILPRLASFAILPSKCVDRSFTRPQTDKRVRWLFGDGLPWRVLGFLRCFRRFTRSTDAPIEGCIQVTFAHFWSAKTIHKPTRVLLMAASLYAAWSIATVSAADFPNRKQIFTDARCSLRSAISKTTAQAWVLQRMRAPRGRTSPVSLHSVTAWCSLSPRGQTGIP